MTIMMKKREKPMEEAPQLVYDQIISSNKKLDWWPGQHRELDQFF